MNQQSMLTRPMGIAESAALIVILITVGVEQLQHMHKHSSTDKTRKAAQTAGQRNGATRVTFLMSSLSMLRGPGIVWAALRRLEGKFCHFRRSLLSDVAIASFAAILWSHVGEYMSSLF